VNWLKIKEGGVSWVPAQNIKEIARIFATTKPAFIHFGAFALDRQASGVQTSRAIAILQVITNNLDVSGGFTSISKMPQNLIRLPHKLEEERMGIDEFPLFYMFSDPYNDSHASFLWDAILAGKPYPIKTTLRTTGLRPWSGVWTFLVSML